MFDRMADVVADALAHALAFTTCVLITVVWLISGPFMGFSDTWQLIMNTLTTVVTFLWVALLHNAQHRFEKATNQRLQEIVEKLPETEDPVEDEGQKA